MKKTAIITFVTILALAGGVFALNNPQPTKAVDSPLVTQVDNQGKQLANHEARISNTENDVKDLQTNTNTAPSSNRTAVPDAAPQPTPQTPVLPPAPITVSAFEIIPSGPNSDCKLTYTDGTTYQWNWKVINAQGAWQTDGNGQNGHWVQTTQINGQCDQSVIGREKS